MHFMGKKVALGCFTLNLAFSFVGGGGSGKERRSEWREGRVPGGERQGDKKTEIEWGRWVLIWLEEEVEWSESWEGKKKVSSGPRKTEHGERGAEWEQFTGYSRHPAVLRGRQNAAPTGSHQCRGWVCSLFVHQETVDESCVVAAFCL